MIAMQGSTKTVTANIANGAALSQALNLCGQVAVGIVMPAAWTTADLSFQTSHDGVTFVPLWGANGSQVQAKAAVSIQIALNPADMAGVRYLKIQSGVAAAVNQGAARALTVITRSVA